MVSKNSVLFITLDSCRYDTFMNASAPSLKAIGPVHKAQAPSYFTYGSHSAMFVGFTPGIPGSAQPVIDPKYGKIFKIVGAGFGGKGTEGYELEGKNIIEGFRNAGFSTIGTAAMSWFDPSVATGRHLSESFENFFFAGPYFLRKQLEWVNDQLSRADREDVFVFINVGETHVPYWHEGAPWSADDNPCLPFQTVQRTDDCRERQRLCLEFVDREIASLLARFSHATILACGDHGDCWGEDGLWEHGIAHPMTLTVPLVCQLRGTPVVNTKPVRESVTPSGSGLRRFFDRLRS